MRKAGGGSEKKKRENWAQPAAQNSSKLNPVICNTKGLHGRKHPHAATLETGLEDPDLEKETSVQASRSVALSPLELWVLLETFGLQNTMSIEYFPLQDSGKFNLCTQFSNPHFRPGSRGCSHCCPRAL